MVQIAPSPCWLTCCDTDPYHHDNLDCPVNNPCLGIRCLAVVRSVLPVPIPMLSFSSFSHKSIPLVPSPFLPPRHMALPTRMIAPPTKETDVLATGNLLQDALSKSLLSLSYNYIIFFSPYQLILTFVLWNQLILTWYIYFLQKHMTCIYILLR